jgi:hypothetical protein
MKLRMLVSFSVAVAIAAVLVFPTSKLVEAQGPPPPMAPTPITTIHMCEGLTAVPSGWVVTDEQVDPACQFTLPNVTTRLFTIKLVSALLKLADQMAICADQPVPPGFIVAALGKQNGTCVLLSTDPNYQTSNNLVKIIRLVPVSTAAAKKKKPD